MGDEADAEFVQGGEEPLHYEQDPEVSTPVLSSLTRPMHIAAWEDAQLNRTVELLTAELAQPQIGATAAVNPGRRMAGPYGRPAPGRPLEAPVSRKWDRSSSGGRQPPRHRGVRRSAAGYEIGLIGNGLSTVDSCQLRAWNATEAYRLIDGEWRIVHSNWAFAQTATGAIAS